MAWHALGWTPAWFSEIEPFPKAVLRHRWPEVADLGDMTLLAERVRSREIAAPDVLVGGTPCQDFSVAGLRAGLAGHRGQLTLVFILLLDAIDEVRAADGEPPCVMVWENVPGVLNHASNPFGNFLGGIAGDDEALEPGPRPADGRSSAHWTWNKKLDHHVPKWPISGGVVGPERTIAWRVLDAQFFGLAQRRRRVFVVAGSGDGFDPAALLLEFDGLRRDTPPSRATREIAPTIPSRRTAGGGLGTDFDCDGGLIAFGGNNTQGPIDLATAVNAHGGPHGRLDFESETFIAHTLRGEGFDASEDGTGRGTPLVPVAYSIMPMNSGTDFKARQVEVSQPIMAAGPAGGNQGGDYVVMPIALQGSMIGRSLTAGPGWDDSGVTFTLTKTDQHAVAFALRGRDDGAMPEVSGDQISALRAASGGSTRDYIAFSSKDYGADAEVNLSPTLRAGGHTSSHANAGVPPAIAFDTTQITSATNRSSPKPGDPCHPLASGAHPPAIAGHGVRRLTPRECERLQGFPDDFSNIPLRNAAGKLNGKWAKDGPRYKALGNSMAVPVMAWIGRRIDAYFQYRNISDLV